MPLLINSPSFFTFHVSLSYYFPLAYKFSIKVFISSWKKIIRNFLNYTFFFKRNRKQSFVRISSLFSLLTNKRKQAPSLINIFVLSIHIFTICWYWNSIDWNLLKKLISSKYLLVRFEISTAIAKCETRVMNRCLDCCALTIQSGPLDTVSRGGTTTVARLSSSVKFSESNSQDCLVVLVQTLTSAWWITGTGRAKAVASISKGATSATVPISPATNWPRIITPARISTSVRPTTGDAPTFVWTRLEALFASARTAFIWPTTGRLAKVSKLS